MCRIQVSCLLFINIFSIKISEKRRYKSKRYVFTRCMLWTKFKYTGNTYQTFGYGWQCTKTRRFSKHGGAKEHNMTSLHAIWHHCMVAYIMLIAFFFQNVTEWTHNLWTYLDHDFLAMMNIVWVVSDCQMVLLYYH